MKNLVIIGNQIDINNDYSNFINNADYVIRFNKMESFNKNTGTKIDELVCRYANAYNIVHGFNNKYEYHFSDINFKNIKFSLILNNFNDTDGLILGNNICKKNNIIDYNIIYNNLNDSYNGDSDTTLASSGKVIIEYVLKKKIYLNYKIYIIGFNWFNLDKNCGHMWKLEREQIEKYIYEKKIIQFK